MRKNIGHWSIVLVALLFFGWIFQADAFAQTKKADKRFTVVYSGASLEKPFWVSLGNYAKMNAEKKGINFIDLTPQKWDGALQKKMIENSIENESIDGIIIGLIDPTIMEDTFDMALKIGKPIILVDTEMDHPAVKGFIATDNLASARIAGEIYCRENKG